MKILKFVSPTGQWVRTLDEQGSGAFKAGRAGHRHKGTDFRGIPGQPVYAVCDGVVVREVQAYEDDPTYRGLVIRNGFVTVKMLYFEPVLGVGPGERVHAGDIIGTMQDVSLRYPGCTPHVHVQIEALEQAVMQSEGIVYINPELLIEKPETGGADGNVG